MFMKNRKIYHVIELMLFPADAEVTLMFQPTQFPLHVWHKPKARLRSQSCLVHYCYVQMRKESACES